MKKIVSLVAMVGFLASLLNANDVFDIKRGWQLLGTSNGISNISSVFNRSQIVTVWIYDREKGSWKVYSPDSNIMQKMQNRNIETFKDIGSHQGFWVYASDDVVVDCNTTTDDNVTYYDNYDNDNRSSGVVLDVYQYPKADLTQDVIDSLAYMGNEERLAHDIYKNLYEYYGEDLTLRVLNNIAERSEIRHVDTVRALVEKYDINVTDLSNVDTPLGDANTDIEQINGKYDIQAIQDLYDTLFEMGKNSKEDALKVGCMVEVTDINDLDEDIQKALDINATDIADAFIKLRSGSYNHYKAFDKALKNMGVSDGCCSLGEIDGVNYCHPEYP